MGRNTSVSLGTHFASFIDVQVQGGRYGTASDVVRAGLRLLEEHEAKMKRVPEFKTDAEAEAFLEQDLSGLDFKQFKPMRFEIAQKDATLGPIPARAGQPGQRSSSECDPSRARIRRSGSSR